MLIYSLNIIYFFIIYWTNTLVNNSDPTQIGKILHQPMCTHTFSKQTTVNVQTSPVRTANVYIYRSRRRPPLGLFGCMVQLLFYISQDLPASHSCF